MLLLSFCFFWSPYHICTKKHPFLLPLAHYLSLYYMLETDSIIGHSKLWGGGAGGGMLQKEEQGLENKTDMGLNPGCSLPSCITLSR